MGIHKGRKLKPDDENLIEFIKDGISIHGDFLSFAESLGWNRKAAEICNQNFSEIAPNGTRRQRRISNSYSVTEDDLDPIKCVIQQIRKENRLNKIEEYYKKYNISKEEVSENIRLQNHNKNKN